MKYYITIELIEEESPLETEVMQRKVVPCKNYEEARMIYHQTILNEDLPKNS